MDYMEITRMKIIGEKEILHRLEARLKKCPPGHLKCGKAHGRTQFYHIIPGQPKPVYINQKHTGLVQELKYKRILQESVKRLQKNILLEEKILQEFQPWDYSTVSSQLPKTYQGADIPWEREYLKTAGQRFTQSENPYYREYLTQPTTFGLMSVGQNPPRHVFCIHAKSMFQRGTDVAYIVYYAITWPYIVCGST